MTPYDRDGWKLVDMPGVMGKAEFQRMALEEGGNGATDISSSSTPSRMAGTGDVRDGP